MDYQVLARKWRPKGFADMVGQQHVVQALSNALKQNRLHHAYLFTGTRGVGKTTVARVIAKCLNCETGITHQPCEQCSACTEINSGRFIDLIEVDAASRTKVEDTRELLDNVQYAPTKGRFKVYLIDEVHMLSGHSFNALLKTLEEPPPHVKFLLATTDPQKLPMTVLSRCLQFHLKNLTIEQIAGQLAHILEQEQLTFAAPALQHLARAADGSMRDALSLLDQAIAQGDGVVSLETVRAMLGTIAPTHLYGIIEALIRGDAQGLYQQTQALCEHGVDFAQVLQELLGLLHQMALLQALPNTHSSLFADNETPRELAQQLTAEQLQLYYQIAILGRRDLPLAPTPRSGFEMTLLRMLAFYPEKPSLLSMPNGAGRATTHHKPGITQPTTPQTNAPTQPGKPTTSPAESPLTPRGAATSAKTPPSPITPEPLHSSAPKAARAQAEPPQYSASAATYSQTEPQDPSALAPTTPSHTEQQQPSAHAQTSPSGTEKHHPFAPAPTNIDTDHWETILPHLKLSGAALAVAQHCTLLQIAEHSVTLQISSGQSPLINERLTSRFQESLSHALGRTVRVEFKVGTGTEATPAQKQAAVQESRQQQAESAISHDKNVQAILTTFGATILPNSVEPSD